MFSHSFSILTLQPGLDLQDLVGAVHLDDAVDLCGVAHELLGAGVEHAQLVVAGRGQVVEHHVGDREAARVLFSC